MLSSANQLAEQVLEARTRSIDLVADLTDAQLSVPYISTINPPLWELCHLTYFQELWVLRRGAGQKPWRPVVDELFDSMSVCHESRWRLPMLSRGDAMEYVLGVRDRVAQLLLEPDALDAETLYYIGYSLCHEDMHAEALTYVRQTLGYAAPRFKTEALPKPDELATGDAEIPGGAFLLGAAKDAGFCHDNEKWAHLVELAPFAISRTAVTEGEVAAFIEDGGYARRELWSSEGWAWRLAENVEGPQYWRRGQGSTHERRCFDTWCSIVEQRAMCHFSWYEADAFCRWAGRRLPTEAEWEAAASMQPKGSPGDPSDGASKPRHPWGNAPAEATHANMDWNALGAIDVRALSAGDSAFGVRQMTGNVWEWTSTTFAPYPGFVPDMYVDYSKSSFETRKVLRGGCWATRSRLMRNTWRNFYQQSRRDVFAGFRTCAL